MLTTGGGRLAGVDVADNDDVDVRLLLTVSLSDCALSMPLWAGVVGRGGRSREKRRTPS